ncbi:PVC-type heme-binding CxxCH protein [Roseibacillus persicicus]|uniref:PVC-type heme-binding CxxCH protein n=1 Tax=Roseibacillus persicicus TaxID=454148 RepID=UPI00398B9563
MKKLWSLLMGVTLTSAQGELIEKGDHVVWIGNVFAERMQYFGDLEASLQSRYPQHELVIRNLGWSADTVSLRPRPPRYGDTHDYLKQAEADVILACFGLNETWKYGGEDGVAKFGEDLRKFLTELKSHQYNGESSPEIVLYSPIAVEDERVPRHLDRNRLLELYRDEMSQVARDEKVHFVDLFDSSRKLMNEEEAALTINGIHLTREGYQQMLPEILTENLFAPARGLEAGKQGRLRAEILEKNDVFFQWYRTVNSFYIHGERKDPYGTVNFPAERKKLLQMARIHDERIHKLLRGEEISPEADYSATQDIPFKIVSPRAVFDLLSPQKEQESFEVNENYEVSLFASEEQFPDLRNPVCFLFDARGRLWVATMPSYPHALPGVKPNDKILIFEDTDKDGRADQQTVFADGLYLPLGFELGTDGVYVSQEPNLVYLKDTDGDDRADEEVILFHGFGSEDSHHAIHNFVWDQAGGLYMQESVFQHSQVETVHGPRRTADNGMFRYDPRTGALDVVLRKSPGGNPWGHAINKWGEHLYVGDHLNPALVNQPQLPGFGAKSLRTTEDTRFCGQEFISSRHFPEEIQGKVFSNIYKNYHGVLMEDWAEQGSGFDHRNLGKVMEAKNQSFIPVDLKFAPDGSLYVADWYNPVLGHMQYSLRDERRDNERGRIWRVTAKGRPLVEPSVIEGQPVEALLDLLKVYEDRTRYRVRRELWKVADEELKPALEKWITRLDEASPDFSLHQMEALWLHQQRGWVNSDLLEKCLGSSDHRSRSAATQVLRYWWSELPQARSLFLQQARDEHPKVRLEAVVGATWTSPDIAVPVLEAVGDSVRDESLEAAYQNAVQALEPVLKNHPMMVEPQRLAEMAMTPAVLRALIRRGDLSRELRWRAIDELVESGGQSKRAALLEVVRQVDESQDESLEDWLAMLVEWDEAAFEVKELDEVLAQLTASSSREAVHAVRLVASKQLQQQDIDGIRGVAKVPSAHLRNEFKDELLTTAKDQKIESERRGAAIFALGYVSADEASLFEELTTHFLPTEEFSTAAAEALLTRGVSTWPKEKVDTLLEPRMKVLAATKVADRGEPYFRLNCQLVEEMAGLVGRTDILQAAQDLKLRVATITSVPDQLRFAESRVEVEAGVPLELQFHNEDGLKHNVVIGAPGSLETMGNAVDASLSDPNSMARDWIPQIDEVLFHTPMADGEEMVVARFQVPETPGEYPYICTVPGHWRVMKGVLVVKN